MQPTSTTANYVTYAALLVTACAHFGWVLSSNDAVSLIAGLVAVASTIYQHYNVSAANTAGIKSGAIVKK